VTTTDDRIALAYLAGLFDGEGWFGITCYARKDCRHPALQLRACVEMRELALVELYRDRFGGTVVGRPKQSPRHSPTFRWTAVGENAAAFAEAVRPYLLAKLLPAAVAVEFQALKRLNTARYLPLTDEQWDRLHRLRLRLLELNQKGIGK
jgi:hypothetical protein